MKIQTNKVRRTYTIIPPSSDYLKYYRAMRMWAKAKHGLTTPDLEILFFLHSENLFKLSFIKEVQCTFSWDNRRFKRLLDDGWITLWRENSKGEAALYTVSHKAKILMNNIYARLEGKVAISEDPTNNPIYKKDATYSQNMTKRVFRKMNLTRKEKKRRADLEYEEYAKQPHVVKFRQSKLKNNNDVPL